MGWGRIKKRSEEKKKRKEGKEGERKEKKKEKRALLNEFGIRSESMIGPAKRWSARSHLVV